MSRDQLQILESSGNRKVSVSPSPSMRGYPTDLNLTPSEDTVDTSRLSLEPGEVSARGQVTCLDSLVTDPYQGEWEQLLLELCVYFHRLDAGLCTEY